MEQFVLVSYDIPKTRRRTRVMKTLEGYGQRVQYSVFECWLNASQIAELQKKLKKLATPEDSIRLYFLCQADTARIVVLGNGMLTPNPLYFIH